MRTLLKFLFTFAVFSYLIISCSKKEPEWFVDDVNKWHKNRIDRLMKPDSWLSLAGLFWLEEGKNSFGSDEKNSIVFPDKAPPFIGNFILTDGKIKAVINKEAEVLHDSVRVTEIEMTDDTQENRTILSLGSLSWYAIKRGEKYGIRLKDSESSLLKSFSGIERFPVQSDWRIPGRLNEYDPPKEVVIPDVLGNSTVEESPAAIIFTKDDEEYSLDLLPSRSGYFVIFADETSGEETYGAGRFLVVEKEDSTGSIFIDFNKAYNPPCAFTKYATCPLPPKQNMLNLRVTAGEKIFGDGIH